MNLLIIRHGIAADAVAEGDSDELRPLTRIGQTKMRRSAKGLAKIIGRPDILATSPLRRARQTADLLAEAFDGMKVTELSALTPRRQPRALMDWLATQKKGALIAIVGHEPHLGRLASWLLTGLDESFIELKKGGACLLNFPEHRRPGHARLLWHLKPSQLRALR